MSGFETPGGIDSADLQQALQNTGLGSENPRGMGLDVLAQVLPTFSASNGEPAALIIDFASRLTNRSDTLTLQEHALFTTAQIACHRASSRPFGPNRQPYYNTIIWVVDRESDLPDWFTLDNPRLRTIPISPPDGHTRASLSRTLLRSLPEAEKTPTSVFEKSADAFVSLTEGLLLTDMNAIVQLGRNEDLRVDEIAAAVRRYKVGVTDDPWKRLDRNKITNAEHFIRSRVKGQEHAIAHMLDIIKRAVTGIGRSPTNGRPRGVAFFAGPTGVGKTELAKTITSLLFGDETAYIRFDMSEFSAEHADQRLLGAPPGYVGYDAGGELTNAMREKPFSIVLFDEIEKAHPRILDKFLQILDDGVLTSGRGDRVYFSEAVIIFTSNLGIYRTEATGARTLNVSADQEHEVVAAKVREEIENHFKLSLNRPEILNRIGENIIVFDFIRRDIAEQIFRSMVDSLLQSTVAAGFKVSLHEDAEQKLRNLCIQDLSNGGRGIRNMIETHLANPLSRALFDSGEAAGTFRIESVVPGPVTTIELVRE